MIPSNRLCSFLSSLNRARFGAKRVPDAANLLDAYTHNTRTDTIMVNKASLHAGNEVLILNISQ